MDSFNGKTVYTLTQVTQSLQSMIERTYQHPYYIRAEMVKLNLYPRTGNAYPELVEKDGQRVKAQLRAVIWSAQFRDINQRFVQITGEPLKDGITVLCLATIQFSPQHGLALYIQDIEPSFTLGEMAKIRFETIARLKKEHVFDANKQLIMPLVPHRIAVISIQSSKGYSDFMITLSENEKGYQFHTELFPSLLQGEKAIATMQQQLNEIEKRQTEFDCVAIIRGGGGDVGLSCYDNYELAHRVATFPLPILSGIGHSTNETITEIVSYANKITPTEVAYYLIGKFTDFETKIMAAEQFVKNQTTTILQTEREHITQYSSQLQRLTAKRMSHESTLLLRLQSTVQRLAQKAMETHVRRSSDIASTLRTCAKVILTNEQNQNQQLQTQLQTIVKQQLANEDRQLCHLSEKLTLLHPANILQRGFSITKLNGKTITHATELKPNDTVVTTFFNGTKTMIVKE